MFSESFFQPNYLTYLNICYGEVIPNLICCHYQNENDLFSSASNYNCPCTYSSDERCVNFFLDNILFDLRVSASFDVSSAGSKAMTEANEKYDKTFLRNSRKTRGVARQ